MFNGKKIKLIAAVSLNNVIGCMDGSIPFQGLSKSDMERFRRLTSAPECNSVLKGRRTWDSLSNKYRPLPGRWNIIVSRNTKFHADYPDCFVVDSIEAGIKIAPTNTVWIIGGAEIYKSSLSYVDEIHMTRIEGYFVGDVEFPFQLDANYWRVGYEEKNFVPPDKIFSTYTIYHRI